MSNWQVAGLFLGLWLTIILATLSLGVFLGYVVQEAGDTASKVIDSYFKMREEFLHRLGNPPVSEVPEEISGYKN